jgi:regulator of RNase E activity RraA
MRSRKLSNGVTTSLTELPAGLGASLAQVSTPTLTTAMLRRGLRNTFLHGLVPLCAGSPAMVGVAFTLRYIPAREDIDVLSVFQDSRHPQRAAIEEAPPGSVLVMDCRGQDRAASAGHILMTRLAHRGVAGMVTDGSVRDSPSIERMAFPVYLRSRSAMTNLALHHAVDLNVPIGCAGVPVYPGDVMVGDAEGVVCIPRGIAQEIADEALEMEELEAFLTARVQAGAPLRGTYPPGEEMLKEYRAQRPPHSPAERAAT